MSALHSILLYTHIALGSIALLLFWLPVIVKKGSKLHNNAGQVFYYIMLLVSGSGMVMSGLTIYDPLAIYPMPNLSGVELQRFLGWRVVFSQFLLLLSLLTWVSVRHAIGVLLAKANRNLLKRLSFLGPVLLMLPLSLFVAWQGYKFNQTLLMIFAGVSFYTAVSICVYIFKAEIKPRQWIIEHFSAMVGTGIAVYTAFFAAGGRRMLSQLLPDEWQLVSWLAAPVIGLTALILLTGYYKRKYKVQPVQPASRE